MPRLGVRGQPVGYDACTAGHGAWAGAVPVTLGWESHRPEMLRKVSVLPVAFLGGDGRGVCGAGGPSGGLDGVGGGVRGVGGDVGGSGNMSRSAGGGLSLGSICLASGGMGVERGGARRAHLDLSARPGTPCFDSPPRPVVSRPLLLEAREYALGAVGGPECQRFVVLTVQLRLPLPADVAQ